MRQLFALMLSAGVALCSAGPAAAALVTYSSEAAFVAATGSTLHGLPTGAGGGYVQAYSIASVDNIIRIDSRSGELVSNVEAITGVSRLAGPDLAISDIENFDVVVQSGADRFAFGFGLYESTDPALPGCNFPCSNSTFEISLWNDGVKVGNSFLLSPADDVTVFWGIHTDFAFDKVTVRETTGTGDNEMFGTFYTGTREMAVPEPGSLALAGLALAGLGLARRRR